MISENLTKRFVNIQIGTLFLSLHDNKPLGFRLIKKYYIWTNWSLNKYLDKTRLAEIFSIK